MGTKNVFADVLAVFHVRQKQFAEEFQCLPWPIQASERQQMTVYNTVEVGKQGHICFCCKNNILEKKRKIPVQSFNRKDDQTTE